MKLFLLGFAILSLTLSAQADELLKESPLATIHGVKIENKVESGRARNIKPNTIGEWGHGFVLGRPVKASYKGIIWNTYELEINQGAFADSSLYIGAVIDISTDDEEVFEKFRTLDQEQQYVFEYKNIFPLNPEIEDSHIQVIAIYTVEEFLKHRKVEVLPVEIMSSAKYQGSVSNGDRNARTGRIVDVERLGLMDDFCTVELNKGGVKGSSSEGGSSEALMVLTVRDEDVCKYAEDALALGVDVEVNYSEDAIEFWSPSGNFANGIRLVLHETKTNSGVQAASLRNSSAEDYEKLKQDLLKDPEFMKALIKELQTQQQQ